MRNNVLKLALMALFLTIAVPFVNAQVRVGDILCDDNSVVSSSSFVSSAHTAIGVVFHVDATGKHGWAVGLEDIGEYAWGPNSKDTPLRNYQSKQAAASDLDGYANTKKILHHGFDIEFPAFDSLDFNNGWYLPAIGQLKRLYKNIDKVNSSLEDVGGTPFSTTEEWEYWSSTEFSVCNAWNIDSFGELHCKDYSFNGNKDEKRLIRGVRNF